MGKNRGSAPDKSYTSSKNKKHFSVMIVPHSEKKGIHFRISLFKLVSLAVIFFVVLAGFVLFLFNFATYKYEVTLSQNEAAEAQASLKEFQDELNHFFEAVAPLEKVLDDMNETLGTSSGANNFDESTQSDFSNFFDTYETDDNTMSEIAELQQFVAKINSSVSSLEDINSLIEEQKKLLTDIPNLWPVKDGMGIITGLFGPAIHPINKYWYIHKGVDFGGSPLGAPIVATADGEVVEVKYEARGYGNMVVIRHKYGFSTLYAHMSRVMVREGQDIYQGQMIGQMGTTGLSTGIHLHYEVRVGSDVVDPMAYLNIKNIEARIDYHAIQNN